MKEDKINISLNIQAEWKSNFLCRRQTEGIQIPAQGVVAACDLSAGSDFV